MNLESRWKKIVFEEHIANLIGTGQQFRCILEMASSIILLNVINALAALPLLCRDRHTLGPQGLLAGLVGGTC